MIEVAFSSSFKRAFKKKVAVSPDIAQRFLEKLDVFKNNPFDSTLRTHKLSGKLKHLWSFTVEYDVRVVFQFVEYQRVVLIDIGTHKEVY